MNSPLRTLCRVALVTLAPLTQTGADPAEFRFEEGARAAGLDFQQGSGASVGKQYLIETIGSGVVVADLNGDEHLDIYLVNGGHVPHQATAGRVNRLFLGDGAGRFQPAPSGDPSQDKGFGVGAVAADYDRDGDIDLYVCNWGPNVLLRNRGDGTFEDVTRSAGVGDPRWSASAAFADLDGDGWLDLYVANYFEFGSEASRSMPRTVWSGLNVAPGPRGMTAEHDRLYRNRGDGTFEDVSSPAGLHREPARYALGVAIIDLDGDDRPDVYVANDSVPNTYWHNEGDMRFLDLGLGAGIALSGEGRAQAGMGIVAEDLSGDGELDLVVTNFARDYTTYYQRIGPGFFQDRTFASQLAVPTFPMLGFGVLGEDFNLDGALDLFVANGHVYPEVDDRPMATSYAQKNQVFRGLGDGRFEPLDGAAGPGLDLVAVSRGAAAGDLDGDGRVDLVVSNLDGPAHLLWNRTTSRGHWLGVRVRCPAGVRDRTCIGSRVTVEAGGRRWSRTVTAGSSFASSSSPDLVFGLGAAVRVRRVEVRFPDGTLHARENLPVDRYIEIEREP